MCRLRCRPPTKPYNSTICLTEKQYWPYQLCMSVDILIFLSYELFENRKAVRCLRSRSSTFQKRLTSAAGTEF